MANSNGTSNGTHQPNEKLHALREQQGLSQLELATKAGYKSPTAVSFLEQGLTTVYLGSDTAKKLAAALGVDPNEFADAPPEGSTGVLHEGGATWVVSDLLDSFKRKSFRDDPAYPAFSQSRLQKLRLVVKAATESKVEGKIRVLVKSTPLLRGDRLTSPWERDYWHLGDARELKQQFPFGSRLLDTGKLALPRRTGKTCEKARPSDPLNEIYRANGKKYVTLAYLLREFQAADGKPVVSEEMWRKYRLEPIPELGRVIDSLELEIDGEIVIVWSLDDAKEIWTRRTNPKARKVAFNGQGSFTDLLGDVFDHVVFGECHSDAWLAKELGVPRRFPGYCRRHPHPALDPKKNDGKARGVREAPLHRKEDGSDGSNMRKWFTAIEDMEAIQAWEARLIQAGLDGNLVEPSELECKQPLDRAAIASKLELGENEAEFALPIVLAQFRLERPGSCGIRYTWTGRTRKPEPEPSAPTDEESEEKGTGSRGCTDDGGPKLWNERLVYVFEDFHTWLKGRLQALCVKQRKGTKLRRKDITELARQLRPKLPSPRLLKDVAFLQFILTHETGEFANVKEDAAAKLALRQFRQFFGSLPIGQPLKPLPDGVPFEKIKVLGKALGIGKARLWAARRWLESKGTEIRLSPTSKKQVAVITLLREVGEPMGPAEVAIKLGWDRLCTKQVMRRLRVEGWLVEPVKGSGRCTVLGLGQERGRVWRLDGPITFQVPSQNQTNEQAPATDGARNGSVPAGDDVGDGRSQENKPGPKSSGVVQVICHHCSEAYSAGKNKRGNQLLEVHRKLKEWDIKPRRVPDVRTMWVYAGRHKPKLCPVCKGEKPPVKSRVTN